MPPQTQDLIYEDPKTKERVKWDGQAWVKYTPEAASVAARPDVNAQAVANLRRPLETAVEEPHTIVLPQGTGAMGIPVTGKYGDPNMKAGREAQRTLAETTGAVVGGEFAAPLGGAGKVVSALSRAAGTGVGAGTGAKATGATNKEAAETAGIWGGTELGLHAALSGAEALYKLFTDPKLSMQQASQMLAGALSKEDLSPAQFGKSIQEGFDAISRKAGAEKGEFIARVASEHPDLQVGSRNVNEVLRTEVNNLNFLKARNPELFHEGEAMDRTLKILQRELNNTAKLNLPTADVRRGQFWNYKQQLDPSMSSRIVGQLDKASTQDITEALVGKDKKLAEEYLTKSQRYHELKDLGRAETLKAVFGDTRVAPGKVIEVFNQAPEDSLAALKTLNRENPVAIQNLRRQLFEQSIKTSGVRSIFKQQPALLREIYGPQADAVSQFVDIVNTKAAGSNSLLSKIPGKAGAMFRIADAAGRGGVTIRASEMAKIMKSAEMVRLFTQAAEMPANSGPARLMRETLDRAVKALDITPGEAPKSRRPLWAEERRTTGASRRQTEGASPTGTERRGKTFMKGVTTQYDMPTEGEQLENTMRQSRGGAVTGANEGQVMQRIMRDPKRYEVFRNSDQKTRNAMMIEEQRKLQDRRQQ